MTALLEYYEGLEEWMDDHGVGLLSDEDLEQLAKEQQEDK